MIYNQHIDPAFAGVEFKAKLLFQRYEDGETGIRRGYCGIWNRRSGIVRGEGETDRVDAAQTVLSRTTRPV